MKINRQPLSLDVIVIHAPGTAPRDAHAAAKKIPGVRLLSTFVDGWGRTVTMAIESARADLGAQ